MMAPIHEISLRQEAEILLVVVALQLSGTLKESNQMLFVAAPGGILAVLVGALAWMFRRP
jgi:hypothetical protein